MKKTSKKLLSFFLAVVMIVTSCSVGFTAFAEDNTDTNKYWNDVTEAGDAFDAIGEIVDTAVPSILGINVNGKKLGALLGMSDSQIQSATLKDVVANASPLLLKALGGSSTDSSNLAYDVDKKTFLMNHKDITGVTAWSDKYDTYYSYLDDPDAKDGDITFYNLYTFCENNLTLAEGKENDDNYKVLKAVQDYCTETLPKLQILLKVVSSAQNEYNSKKNIGDMVYTGTNASGKGQPNNGLTKVSSFINKTKQGKFTVDALNEQTFSGKINNITFSNVKLGDFTTDTTVLSGSTTLADATKAGMEYVQNQFDSLGANLTIDTPAKALMYYYAFPENGRQYDGGMQVGITYYNALLYISLAQKGGVPITTKAIGGDTELSISNYESVLLDYINAQKAAGDPRYTGYEEGKEYYYIPLAVYECLCDKVVPIQSKKFNDNGENKDPEGRPCGIFLSDGPISFKTKENSKWETFASSSYEAINAELLYEAGNYESLEAAKKAINDAKITKEQYKAFCTKVNEFYRDPEKKDKYEEYVLQYVQSDECKMSKYIKDYFRIFYSNGSGALYTDYLLFLQQIRNYQYADYKNITDAEIEEVMNIPAENYEPNSASLNLYQYIMGRNEGNLVSYVNFINDVVSGFMTRMDIDSGTNNPKYNGVSSTAMDYMQVNVAKAVQNGLTNPETGKKYAYKYSDYTMPSDVSSYYKGKKDQDTVAEVNYLLNKTISNLLDPSSDTGAIVAPIINGLMESKITLYNTAGTGALNDLWSRLYNAPTETIFNLLPTLVILVEEVVFPMVLNAEGDERYQALDFLFKNLDVTLIKDGQIANTSVGVTDASFDLNTILPGVLAYFAGDSEKALKYCGTYNDYLESQGLGNNAGGIDGNTIMFTGVYVADKAIYNLNLKSLLASKMDADLATGLNELIVEIAGFALEATEEYIADSGEEDYRYSIDYSVPCKTTQRGLNNVAIALPKLIDRIGKKVIEKYDIPSDWTYLYTGKLDTTKDKTYPIQGSSEKNTVTQHYNTPLEEFKSKATYEAKLGETADEAAKRNAVEVLDLFANAFTGTWVNSLLDFLNDTIGTSNKLTGNLELVAGLLNSLGGFGEKSILTDVLNGLFDLSREDKASFTFKKQDDIKNFVGLSKESGFFLISNIIFNDGQKGLIPLIKNVIAGVKYAKNPTPPTYLPGQENLKPKDNTTTTTTKTQTKKPTLVSSSKTNKKYDTSKLLTKKNVKNANSLLKKLDTILASLLDNSSLNDFVLNSNENVLAGVLTTASNYLGENNTKELITLVDDYLNVFNTTAKNGKVDADKVYTDENLSNIVIKTYTLIENIVNYLFYNNTSGILRYGDEYQVITGAIDGIYSPDSLSVRVKDRTAKSIKGKKSWKEVTSVSFGVTKGDKESFYDGLGQSLTTLATVLGAVLTFSYTSADHSDNLYSVAVEPVLKAVAKHTGATGVVDGATFNLLDAPDQLVKGIITPLANIITQFYKAPATFLVNLVASLGDILNDQSVTEIVNGVIGVANYAFKGFTTIVGNKAYLNAPTLVKALGKMAHAKTDLFTTELQLKVTLPKSDIIVGLIRGIKISSLNMTVGQLVALKSINWRALANANNAGEKLILIFGYLVDVLLSSPVILGLVKDASPEIYKLLSTLNPAQILAIINAILDVTQSPTEIFWTFREYAGEVTKTFVYPKGITASESNEAVDNLDKLVQNVFPLLKDLGVLDYEDLPTLVNSLLYKNELITKLATTVYGGIYDAVKKAGLTDTLKSLGIDLSPKGLATVLMDESYGRTYSSAAKTLKKAKSWSKVKKVNWGFKDGSDKAQTGFINALTALLRPVNSVLSIFLAEGKGLEDALSESDIKDLLDTIKKINIKKQAIGGIKEEDPYGCKLYLTIKNGVLTLTIDSNGSDDDSTFKCNIYNIAKTLVESFSDTSVGFGTNGYENAVIPLLEAFLCDDVVTYKQYLKDYEKAKDNLLLDILNPLFGLVDEVLASPANKLTAILPNLAYFIDSNGLGQVVNNLLAPITSKKGLVGILKKNGVDVDKIIKAITGKSLGKIVTDALGLNVKLNLKITDLTACNIQDIVLPLIKTLLKKNNINIKIPDFTFADIASHGKVVTAKSAAKNNDGEYKREMVQAYKGEMFVALLRYVGDVLIKNATTLNNMLGNIKAIKDNKTISDILNCVFSSLKVATKDDIVRAVFYFLTQNGAQDSFFDYSNFKTKKYDFSFGNMDEEFCRKLAPMLDGLVGGLLADKGGLLGLIGGMAYTDDVISSIACGLYGAVDGVDLGDMGSLSALLAKTGIDFTTTNVANLLTDKRYGKKFSKAANVISKAGSWKNVKKEDLKWGVKDRDTFLNALVAVLRPVYGVVDVLLNNGNLNLFNIVSVPGSNGYTSFIVPLLEAFGVYNIKTQYDYRMDMEKAYDALLLDIINPLWDKVEDILNAPIEMLADILPNLSLFFANNGLLQLIDNLLTPVSALLDAVKPIINVNVVLDVLNVDVNALLGKIGINSDVKVDVYDLKSTLEPLIGSDNVVSLLNGILGTIKIKGQPLGIVLPEIDWFQLASHGKVVSTTSQVATFGTRIAVQSDQDETLIAVLRYLINTINYKDNYNTIVNLLGGLLGGLSDSIAGVVDQVLGMLKGDADTVIESLVDLLQSIAG